MNAGREKIGINKPLPGGLDCKQTLLQEREQSRFVQARFEPLLQLKGGDIPMLAYHYEGQGMVEYALVIIMVAIVAIIVLGQLGAAIGNIFSNIVANL